MKKIALIGSTGSIGKQVINVALRYPEKFKIVAMSANSNSTLFAEQLKAVKPEFANLRDENASENFSQIPENLKFLGGEKGYDVACAYQNADIVFNAVTGFAGLKVSLLAIENGKDLALANKESLVVGGALVMPLAKKMGVKIMPVDSEHSAIWQCLNFDYNKPYDKILLTASGGALRNTPISELEKVTAQQALCHPNWDMGAKITIDCATMLNKGFEVIEAMWLYNAKVEDIEVVIHKESIIHSMVAFADGTTMAQLSYPSMELPIQLALTFPERIDCALPRVDFFKLGALHFDRVDENRYPCFKIAIDCAKAGGTAPCVLNAAGEIAVSAFLKGQIKYTQIAHILEKTVNAIACEKVINYQSLVSIDAHARSVAKSFLEG